MLTNLGAVENDRFDVIDEGENVRGEADLFGQLARGGLAQSLSDFHHAAGQRVEPGQGRPRAPRDEHAPFAEHRDRGRQNWPRGIEPFIHARPHTYWPPASGVAPRGALGTG